MISKFLKLNPHVFSGGVAKPEEAERWLKKIEKLFVLMEIGEEPRVRLATYMLKDDAETWWEASSAMMTTQVAGGQGPMVITWDQFRGQFEQQFLPRSYRFQKESEFIRLEQGTASVVEHEARFTTLSRYTLDLVRTEDAKMRCFLESLNRPIRHRLTTYDLLTMLP